MTRPWTRRQAAIGLGLLASVAAITTAATTLPGQQWWPGWDVIGTWLRTWLPPLMTILLAGAAIRLIRKPAPRPPTTTAQAGSIVWERQVGGPGLLPRPVLAVAPATPAAVTATAPRQRNWSAITSGITAFTALAALVFTAQSLSSTRDQIRLSEQGQITDRYTSAINQIGTPGDDHLATRLGGIYSLERLAQDSPRDQPTIIQVLSAFVRSSAPIPTAGLTACPTGPVKPDVQAALTVLGRRNATQDQNTRIDLSNSCLANAKLGVLDAGHATFGGINFDGANFDGTNLTNAQLGGTHLVGAFFGGALLSGTDFVAADLANAEFGGATLVRAYLTGANATHANFGGANLTDAQLGGAFLTDATFVQANLGGAFFLGAHLVGLNVTEANYTDAVLPPARLVCEPQSQRPQWPRRRYLDFSGTGQPC